MVTLRAAAVVACTIVALWAAGSGASAEPPVPFLLHQAAVFSDDLRTIHDPRHPQPQTGADKMFAPIGVIQTNRRLPNQGTTSDSSFHMGTAFLVSPCYVLTNYHVVFGNWKGRPPSDQDFSATFSLGDKKSRAVPVKYGAFYRFRGRDWVLLRLDSDAEHRCLGENPDIGWVRLAPLSAAEVMGKSLSVAGYPSDKSLASLWRQDTCHVFEKRQDIENDGLWTTDCATRPRSSGSPVFFIEDGVLNVVALMSGHMGVVVDNEILSRWDPGRANLALDIGKIISSDEDFLKLIAADIDRFHQPNPAQVFEPQRQFHPQPAAPQAGSGTQRRSPPP